jgi:hypothetical protein
MAHDALLTATSIEEALSEVYVRALAASAGYTTSKPDFDRDSVGISVNAGGNMRPQIDIQLKASINSVALGDTISYFCPKRNYDLLRRPTMVPRVLVLFQLPHNSQDWLAVHPDELILKHRAHWMSLKGYPETQNETGCTIYIPTANRLDVAGLTALLEKSRNGSL